MKRASLVLLAALVMASCGGDDGWPSTTSATTSSAASSTTGATTSTTAPTTTGAPTSTTSTTVPTTVWADLLVGRRVWAEWNPGGELRRLLAEGVGDTGLLVHLDFCVSVPDWPCTAELLFAARPIDPPQALGEGFDGMIALVRPLGGDTEGFTVLDAVDVVLAPGTGVPALVGATPAGPWWGVELGFAAGGPVVLRAWSPDLLAEVLAVVDPAASGLPDVASSAMVGSVVGRVVTPRPYVSDPTDPYRILDLSAAPPGVVEGVWEWGGGLLGQGEGALGWRAVTPGGVARVVWLEQWLGWTYTGHALWRVRDATEFPVLPGAGPALACTHTPSGHEAVALVDASDCIACPVVSDRAFRVDVGEWRLVRVPPAEVACTCECGG